MNASVRPAIARACANIAFIKYWGNRLGDLNLPLNPSISMSLDSCVTATQVEPIEGERDEILIGGRAPNEKSLARTVKFLDAIRQWAGSRQRLRVVSENSFPTGCGIASSASGFAALAAAAAAALGKRPGADELSRLARLGSGSAARSVMGGFVELPAGDTHEACAAAQLADENWWPALRDVVVILSGGEKATSSAEGHKLAATSELFEGRLRAVPARAQQAREAIRRRDLVMLGEASEADALSMHAVMMTSHPPLFYWTEGTIRAINAVHDLRRSGAQAYFTIDAGPNVHILCLAGDEGKVTRMAEEELRAGFIIARPGPGAELD